MKRKKTKHDKTLVLLLNVKGAQASWQVHAHLRHVMDGLKRFALPSEQLIIMPVVEQTAFYWLEGDPKDPKDIKTLDQIKDRLQPTLKTTLAECLTIKPGKLDTADGIGKIKDLFQKQLEKLPNIDHE